MTEMPDMIDVMFRTDERPVVHAIRDALDRVSRDVGSVTERQLYYMLINDGTIEHTTQAYGRVQRLLYGACMHDVVSWPSLTTGYEPRQRFGPVRSSGLDAVANAAANFETDRWEDQDARVEVWLDVFPLRHMMERACASLQVPVYQVSDRQQIARALYRHHLNDKCGQRTVVLHMSDLGIGHSTAELRNMLSARGSKAMIDRFAVTQDQVDEHDIPTWSDNQARHELEAFPPAMLVPLLRDRIMDFIDQDIWDQETEYEEMQREKLACLADYWADGEFDAPKQAPVLYSLKPSLWRRIRDWVRIRRDRSME